MKITFVLVLLLSVFTTQAFAGKTQREQDIENLRKEKKLLAEAKSKLSKDQRDLKSLKDAMKSGAGSVTAGSNDCYTLCRPSSEGGNCPDEIFHNGHIVVGADVKWDAVNKKFVAGAQLDQAVGRYQNAVAGSTVCEQVRMVLKAGTINPLGHLDCETAAENCKYVKLPKDISSKESEVSDDKSDISELENHIAELTDDTENGCANCGSAYSQREPTKAESTAMILGSIFPYFSAGMSGYLQASGQNKYYSAYSNYLSSCTTIGVPCNGPTYAGTTSGELSLAAGLAGAYSKSASYVGSYASSGTAGYAGTYASAGYAGTYASAGYSGAYTNSGMAGYSGAYSGSGIAGYFAGYSGGY